MIWLLEFNLGRMSVSMPLVSCSMRARRVYAIVAVTVISARMTAKLVQIRRRIVQSFMACITFNHCMPGAEGRLYPKEQNRVFARCTQSHSPLDRERT